MYKLFFVFGLSTLLITGSSANVDAAVKTLHTSVQDTVTSKALIGRWDITIDQDGKQVPSWLQVKLSGVSTLTGSFVAESGSARPVAEVIEQHELRHLEAERPQHPVGFGRGQLVDDADPVDDAEGKRWFGHAVTKLDRARRGDGPGSPA